jgi:hypothetical protein
MKQVHSASTDIHRMPKQAKTGNHKANKYHSSITRTLPILTPLTTNPSSVISLRSPSSNRTGCQRVKSGSITPTRIALTGDRHFQTERQPRCMSRSYGAAARSSWGLLMWQILVICRTVPSGDKLFIRNQVGTHSFLPAPAPELPPPRATGPPRGRSKLLGSI